MRRISVVLCLSLLLGACGDDGSANPPDETAPVVTLVDLERFALLAGTAEVAVWVDEDAAVKLLAGDTVLAEARTACHPSDPPICDGGPAMLRLDVADVPDGLLRVTAIAIDDAGNVGRSVEVPVIVANRGERIEVDYDPAPEVSIPEAYEGVELDVRATAESRAGIRKIITWVTWENPVAGDAVDGWLLEYSLGQGLCPHRGIQYVAEESFAGEIVLELDRADVDPDIVATYPEADRESDTFPTGDDPLTYGLFFGHVKPMEPAAHAGASLPIQVGLVYLYAED